MNEDFLYSRCADCHKLINDEDYCTAFVGPHYSGELPYLEIAGGLVLGDSLAGGVTFFIFQRDVHKFFNKTIYIKCLGCHCLRYYGWREKEHPEAPGYQSGCCLGVIKKKDFMELEPKLHNSLIGFSLISG